VYSYGLILFSLFTKRRPFPDLDPKITIDLFKEKLIEARISPLGGEEVNEEMDTPVKDLIEQCIATQKSVRLSFAALAENDSEIIRSVYLKMTSGKQARFANDFWERFGGADRVEFDTFFPALEAYFTEVNPPKRGQKPLGFDEEAVRFFKHAVGVDAMTKSANQQIVHLEVFRGFLDRFGDLLSEDIGSLLQGVTRLYKEPWFYSSYNSTTSESLLQAAKARNFIIRYSAKDIGAFTLSKIVKGSDKGSINHVLLPRGSNVFQEAKELMAGTSRHVEKRKKYTPPSEKVMSTFPKDHIHLSKDNFQGGFHGGYETNSVSVENPPIIYGNRIAQDDPSFVV